MVGPSTCTSTRFRPTTTSTTTTAPPPTTTPLSTTAQLIPSTSQSFKPTDDSALGPEFFESLDDSQETEHQESSSA